MIQVAPGTKVYLACQPVSMRYSFDGLSAKVASVLARDPFSGQLFLFRSKRGDYLKILYWDGSGLCLFAKRLERGRFVWPPIVDGALVLTPAQLALLIEAIESRYDNSLIWRSFCRHSSRVVVEEGMPSATASLPSDPAALRAFAAALQEALATKERELAARDAEIYAKTLHIEKLRATLALMKRARFGRSSERIEQLELLVGDLEEEEAEQQARQDEAVPERSGETAHPLVDLDSGGMGGHRGTR